MSKQWNRVFLLAIPVLLALIFSAFTVTPALADDSVPPPAEPAVIDSPVELSTGTDAAADDSTPAEEPTVVEESAPVEETVVVVEPVPTAEPVVAEETAPTEEPVVAEEPALAEEAVAETVNEVLEQLPEGTGVVVTDATGEVLPLVTTEAAEAIVTGDPMWCPTGVTPGGAGCTTAQTSFADLLPLIGNKTVAGTIWIASSYNSALDASVTLDGTLGTTVDYALTLQGGWSGTLGSAAINTSSPSVFNIPLAIAGWNANVTLNDILVTAVSGSGSTALSVTTTKDIALNRVEVRDNVGSGANLNNLGGTGTVTVTSSKFNNNAGGTGLTVNSKGTITLNSVIASGNGNYGYGAYLDNQSAATPLPVTLTGTNVFESNSGDGLDVISRGIITLNNVTANGNGTGHDDPNSGAADGIGVFVDNRYSTAAAPQDVIIDGTNVFNSNWLRGLEVQTFGAITLYTTTASYNGQGVYANPAYVGWGYGAFLNNCQYDSGQCATVTPKPVNIIGFNTFNGNAEHGLYVLSKGDITATGVTYKVKVKTKFRTIVLPNGVTANDNGLNGILLDNQWTGAIGGIYVNGTHEFARNDGKGIEAYSNGSIVLADLDAYENGGNGVYLNNNVPGTLGSVSVGTSRANWVNWLGDNGGTGIEVYSRGTITLLNVAANGNGYDGAFLDNSNAATAMAVNITNSTFNDNAKADLTSTVGEPWTFQMGLQVFSKGAITLTDIDANYNGNGDADIDDGGVYLDNTAGTAGISMYGTNFISDNEWGLGVFSNGSVLLYNLVNNGNSSGSGAYIDNCGWNGTACTSAIVAPVTILGTNEFKLNGRGLHVTTNGAITLNNITATFNGWTGDQDGGAYLWNANSATSAGVTLTGLNAFSNNNMTGLQVRTKGSVTLYEVTANNNGWYDSAGDEYFGYGAYIRNMYSTTPMTVSILGTNTFIGNANGGLLVLSKGAITANNVSANNNGWVDPTDTDPTDSTRAITNGASFDNCSPDNNGHCTNPTLTSSVTLTGTNTFNDNYWGHGLYVSSLGAISVNNLTADNNFWQGALLDNMWDYFNALAADFKLPYTGVTVSGYGNASNNGNSGIWVRSTGIVTMSNPIANGNGGSGVFIDNCGWGWSGTSCSTDPAVTLPVTILGMSSFNNNYLNGLEVHSKGTILASGITYTVKVKGKKKTVALPSGITARNNGGYGVFIDNSEAAAAQAVTLNGTNTFNDNALSGLEVYSKGAITLNNVDAHNNGSGGGGDGVHLRNSQAATPQPVTLTGYNNFSNNYNNGLQVISKGAITVYNLTSNNNGDGAELYNTDSGTALPQNVTLYGFGEFRNNYNNGLDIKTYGAITLYNIDAEENGQSSGTDGFGAYLDNGCLDFGVGCTATLVRPVTLYGENNFYNNLDGGLEVHSLGLITVGSVTADSNSFGIWLDNNRAGALGGVTITGGAWTSENDEYGMDIASKGAININVNDAWVGNNGTYGWYLDNAFDGAIGGITLASPNTDWAFDFSRNGGFGLWARSLGAISVAGLDSSENGSFGAQLDNAFLGSVGTITITAPATGNNDFSGNVGDGLLVFSNRAIISGGLNANDNGNIGVLLNNTSSGPALPQSVILTGNNDFHGNGDTGLLVLSYGAIALNNVTANNNGQNNDPDTGWGVFADNCGYNSGSNSCDGVPTQGITLSGVNNFHNNDQDGLFVRSLGAILISNIESVNNGGNGAYLDNQWGVAHQNITLTGYGNFNNNGGNGLAIYTNGSVSLINVSANSNDLGGAVINASDKIFSPANVTISGINYFEGNRGGDGLNITAFGVISLNNINANWNSGRGAFLDNIEEYPTGRWAPIPNVRLYLTGINTFNGNSGNGLEFLTYGNVSMTKVTADRNGGNGVLGSTIDGYITLTCGSMNGNGGRGYDLTAANGTITLYGVNGYSNASSNLLTADWWYTYRACP